MKKNLTNKIPALVGPVCILAGILCILASAGISFLDYSSERKLTETLEQMIGQVTDGGPQEESEITKEKIPQGGSVSGMETEDKLPAIPIGMMEIPAIEMKAAIVEGSNTKDLKNALGHLKGTAAIGAQAGNCVIAGHRNYTFGRFFNRLDEIIEGDLIFITGMDGEKYEYTVTGISIVEPEDISVLEQTEDATLTLVTCTPIYIASHRLIITCKLLTGEHFR